MSGGIVGRIESLSAREKGMVAGMGLAFLAFLGFLGYLLVGTTISDLETSVNTKQSALETIEALKDRYLQQQATGSPVAVDALQDNRVKLTPFVEEAAKRFGITVDDYKERRTPLGKKRKTKDGEEVPEMWEENLTISFKQVDMDRLSSFLDEVDQPARLIFVKKLSLKRSWSDKSDFRVTMTLATYKKA